MNAPIVVGTNGTKTGLDAVALAVRIAGSIDAPLVVAYVHRPTQGDQPAPVDAAAALAAARELAGPAAAEYRAVASSSAARGLTELAEHEHAELLVTGSTNRGVLGRVTSGSTADRLLHGTAVPVTVAPAGYRRKGTGPLRALGVAFVDTPEGWQALGLAGQLAARSGLPLTVYEVIDVDQTWFTPQAAAGQPAAIPHEVREEYERSLHEAVKKLPDGVNATDQLLVGEVVEELSALDQQGIDLLVCGSRGYGPVRRVLLGSVSHALVHHSGVPIVVVPRGEP